jgi:hypothetical protein
MTDNPMIHETEIMREGRMKVDGGASLPLVGRIEIGEVFCWEPDLPHARELCVVSRIEGERIWMWDYPRRERESCTDDSRFREACFRTRYNPVPSVRPINVKMTPGLSEALNAAISQASRGAASARYHGGYPNTAGREDSITGPTGSGDPAHAERDTSTQGGGGRVASGEPTPIADADRELLVILAEEAAEVVQAVTKILRHGLDNHHPHGSELNREALGRECGEFSEVLSQLAERQIVAAQDIDFGARCKREDLPRWLHGRLA